MASKKKTVPSVPPAPDWNQDEADDAIPASVTPEAGTPEPIVETHESHRPFTILDEKQFMSECCERLNAFCRSYPLEAMQLLSTWLPYQFELIEISRKKEEMQLEEDGKMPIVDDEELGLSVAALFSGLLQTQRGTGYFIRPYYEPHPDQPEMMVVAGFEVIEQDYEDSEKD
jgi:hypothetical protein